MKPTSSAKPSRGKRPVRLLGKGRNLESSVLACAQAPTRSAPPSAPGLQQARRMIGGVPGIDRDMRVERLANKLDRLSALLREEETSSSALPHSKKVAK